METRIGNKVIDVEARTVSAEREVSEYNDGPTRTLRVTLDFSSVSDTLLLELADRSAWISVQGTLRGKAFKELVDGEARTIDVAARKVRRTLAPEEVARRALARLRGVSVAEVSTSDPAIALLLALA